MAAGAAVLRSEPVRFLLDRLHCICPCVHLGSFECLEPSSLMIRYGILSRKSACLGLSFDFRDPLHFGSSVDRGKNRFSTQGKIAI